MKEWKYMIVLGIVLLAIWSFTDYSQKPQDYQNNYDSHPNLTLINEEENIINQSPKIKELHWDHMPLTYFIKESCKTRLNGDLEKGINDALVFISEKTDNFITFENKSDKEVDIIFNCDTPQFQNDILAEALPEISDKNIITSGEIFIYSADDCLGKRPVTLIHEIMHLLGINHYTKTSSEDIMRAVFVGKEFGANPCDNELMDRDVSCLKYIYSNGEVKGNCSDVEFFNLEYECQEGLYPTIDGKYCCDEPEMIIDEYGYCDYPL